MTEMATTLNDGTRAPRRMAALSAKKPQMRKADRTFLPAALEIIETPSAPLAWVFTSLICAFFVVALVWSYVGKIDVIASAQGKIKPTGGINVVQTLMSGRVIDLPARDGAKVRHGDVLFRLDAHEADAELQATSAELANFEGEILRRSASIAHVESENPPPAAAIDFPDTIPKAVQHRKSLDFFADIAAYDANVAKLRAEAVQKEAEQTKLIELIAAQKSLISLIEERVNLRGSMRSQGLDTMTNLMQARESMAQQMATLAEENGRLREIDAGLKSNASLIHATRKAFVQDNMEKLDEASRQVAIYRGRLSRAEWTLSQTVIRSPVDGIVQSSTLTTIGQVVEPGTELLRIVPENADIEVECYLPNKDVGFVKPGQQATLKVESFPFTRYGTIEATVSRVAQDAIPEPEASLSESDPTLARRQRQRAGADRVQNLVFPVTLRIASRSINVNGASVPLRAGMAVTVEIKTDERRLLDYVLSPVRQVGSEALRER